MNERLTRSTLFNSEDRTIFCAGPGRQYHLSVGLPEYYDTSDRAYPVVYLLDGDAMFGMAAGLTPSLSWYGAGEVIVVGISYGVDTFEQFGKLRELDFKIPEVKDAPPDSHAELFLDALIHEMIPVVEANYRTIPAQRSIFGYSSGGFFVLYALCNQPEAFRHYLCGSPVLYISYPYFIQHDQKLAQTSANNPIDLFLTLGEREDYWLPEFKALIAHLEDKRYPGLKLSTEIYPGEGHGPEGIALTYFHGLRRAYPGRKDQDAE